MGISVYLLLFWRAPGVSYQADPKRSYRNDQQQRAEDPQAWSRTYQSDRTRSFRNDQERADDRQTMPGAYQSDQTRSFGNDQQQQADDPQTGLGTRSTGSEGVEGERFQHGSRHNLRTGFKTQFEGERPYDHQPDGKVDNRQSSDGNGDSYPFADKSSDSHPFTDEKSDGFRFSSEQKQNHLNRDTKEVSRWGQNIAQNDRQKALLLAEVPEEFEGETKYDNQLAGEKGDTWQFTDEDSDGFRFSSERKATKKYLDRKEISQWVQNIDQNNRPIAAVADKYNRSHEIDALREKGSTLSRGKCVKSIYIYADKVSASKYPELDMIKTALAQTGGIIPCTSHGYDCDISVSVGVDPSTMTTMDAVVVGVCVTGETWFRERALQKLLERDPRLEQTWVYYSTEPPYRVVHWSRNTDVAKLKYHVLMTYNQQADIHIPFGYYQTFSEAERQENKYSAMQKNTASYNATEIMQRTRTGLISWVASNCAQVFWPRMNIVARLRELISLDDYGGCGHKSCLPYRSAECNRVFASYKFYLATPNSECDDYITEKFWDISLNTGVVPVVIGARKRDYERVAPPNSFIHAGDFESLVDLADYLKKVDMDDELYASYHAWRMKGEVIMTYPLSETDFCRILPHMRTRTPAETKLVGDSPWYRGCREIPGDRHTRISFPQMENWTIWK